MKNISKEDEYIRQLITGLGTDSPSEDFHKSVIAKLRPKRKPFIYTPVISQLAWKIISGAIATIIIAVILFIPSGESSLPLFDLFTVITLSNAISVPKISLPKLNLSTIVIQSLIGFIILAAFSTITTIRKWKTS